MGVLAGMPNISANQITNAIGLDKGAVSRALHELEKRSLIASELDPKDNRSRIVRLSKAGDALHDRGIVAALAREQRLLSTLSPHELETLIVCLRKSGQTYRIPTLATLPEGAFGTDGKRRAGSCGRRGRPPMQMARPIMIEPPPRRIWRMLPTP
jgi:DNA-binding MarR family transcriptional regulator